MDKKIEDYLHLYLGCDVEYNLSSMRYVLIGIESDAAYIFSESIGMQIVSMFRIKPILRPLSDMTEEDYAYLNDGYNNSDKHSRYGSHYWEAEQTRYLLSKHFDLFGLVESGLAIDKTTFKK